MSVDIINDEDNFLKLLGDDEEELTQSEELFPIDIPNFSADEKPGSDSGKTDDDVSISGNNEVPENTTSGRWNAQEHNMFLDGLRIHGKGWKKIAEMIQTRNVVQVRTHAQKYFQKLERSKQLQLMNSGNGSGSGGVIGPVSVSIAENSSIPCIDSVMYASSSGEDSGEYPSVKTTAKRKRKCSKGIDDESPKLKISIKKGRKANENLSPKIEFDRASQDETDEETKSETSNSDIATTISSTVTSFQPDLYDNDNNLQSHMSLKIKLEKTKEAGATGTPSPISITEEVPTTQAPVLDDWLHVENALTLNFHADIACGADLNSSKSNDMNNKHNKCGTAYAIPVTMDSVLTNGGFFESTFDDSIITQDILEIFDV